MWSLLSWLLLNSHIRNGYTSTYHYAHKNYRGDRNSRVSRDHVISETLISTAYLSLDFAFATGNFVAAPLWCFLHRGLGHWSIFPISHFIEQNLWNNIHSVFHKFIGFNLDITIFVIISSLITSVDWDKIAKSVQIISSKLTLHENCCILIQVSPKFTPMFQSKLSNPWFR